MSRWVGRWQAGLVEDITNLARLKLELELSLAKIESLSHLGLTRGWVAVDIYKNFLVFNVEAEDCSVRQG